MSKFTTEQFFTFFPVFFHMEQGTFTLINRARTCTGTSESGWAPHVEQRWKICPTQVFQIYCTQYNYEKKKKKNNNFRIEYIRGTS